MKQHSSGACGRYGNLCVCCTVYCLILRFFANILVKHITRVFDYPRILLGRHFPPSASNPRLWSISFFCRSCYPLSPRFAPAIQFLEDEGGKQEGHGADHSFVQRVTKGYRRTTQLCATLKRSPIKHFFPVLSIERTVSKQGRDDFRPHSADRPPKDTICRICDFLAYFSWVSEDSVRLWKSEW